MESDLTKRHTPVTLSFTSCSTNQTEFDTKFPPIVLVHGLFATNSTWNRVKCQLGNFTRRKVLSVDLRNHGGTAFTCNEEFSVRHMAADLVQFLRDQHLSKAVFIGHSIGGRVVMELALRMPEMVEKLVVEDISISDAPDEKIAALISLAKQMHRVIPQLPISMSEADAIKMMNRIMSKYVPQLQLSEDVGKIAPFYKDENTGEFKFHFNIEATIHILEQLENCRIDISNESVYPGDTLFIKGEHTVFPIEEDRDLILKYFPRTEFLIMKGAHHVSHTEKPDEFTRKVADFIKS